ncbi:hypothetical protein M0R45_020525 [Rubus argutus]|uniref:Uncharacterized protein n=1 Tax=Rubus argutus TaxID=59490 RepID=A0AAW1XAF3_RUBAR
MEISSLDSRCPGPCVLPPPGDHHGNAHIFKPPINQSIRFFNLDSLKALPTLESEKHTIEVRDYACVHFPGPLSISINDAKSERPFYMNSRHKDHCYMEARLLEVDPMTV